MIRAIAPLLMDRKVMFRAVFYWGFRVFESKQIRTAEPLDLRFLHDSVGNQLFRTEGGFEGLRRLTLAFTEKTKKLGKGFSRVCCGRK